MIDIRTYLASRGAVIEDDVMGECIRFSFSYSSENGKRFFRTWDIVCRKSTADEVMLLLTYSIAIPVMNKEAADHSWDILSYGNPYCSVIYDFCERPWLTGISYACPHLTKGIYIKPETEAHEIDKLFLKLASDAAKFLLHVEGSDEVFSQARSFIIEFTSHALTHPGNYIIDDCHEEEKNKDR